MRRTSTDSNVGTAVGELHSTTILGTRRLHHAGRNHYYRQNGVLQHHQLSILDRVACKEGRLSRHSSNAHDNRLTLIRSRVDKGLFRRLGPHRQIQQQRQVLTTVCRLGTGQAVQVFDPGQLPPTSARLRRHLDGLDLLPGVTWHFVR